jgi:mono/diheme cytochrome c family protein
MNITLKSFFVLALLVAVSTLLSGCGEDKEDNVPTTKLTASAVASETATDAHGHTVTIPFTDVSSSPALLSQYRSSDTNGHSHVIALSKEQLTDLSSGMRLTVTSSTQNTHSHLWNISGGTVLYDKYCYNCHTNDKRGHNPMNVSFSASQINAVKNQAAAQLSTSPPVVPDPGYSTTVETSIDGVFLYGKYCASCHGQLVSSSKSNRSAAQIKTGMGSMGLSDAQILAIATALKK